MLTSFLFQAPRAHSPDMRGLSIARHAIRQPVQPWVVALLAHLSLMRGSRSANSSSNSSGMASMRAATMTALAAGRGQAAQE